MTDTVQAVKDKLSIVDVVSSYVKLTKAGKYYRGLSPFNKEKTPSFFVTPDRGLYHCFSSGKGGDMFTFVEEMEGVDFKGALKILAERAGVPLSYENTGERNERERLYAVIEEANKFFIDTFLKKTDAESYLIKRGLTKDTLKKFSVGYAPKEWRSVSPRLAQKGFSEKEIETAGLTKRPESGGEPYDRFRGRIMFPIRDVSGRTVGFSGRIFEDDPKHPGAKYLNSPETPVFNKSRILFGIDSAREGIRKYGFSILVEGQVDLLMAHQAGYVNTVALSGTSFTDEHAALLFRYSPNLVIAFDSDRAGVAAAGRAAQIALTRGMNVKLALLPPGDDPADLIQKDLAGWKRAVKDAEHVVDFYLGYLKDLGYDERRFSLEVSRVVLPYVAAIENEIDRAHFVHRVAEKVNIPDTAVSEEVRKLRTKPHEVREAETVSDRRPSYESRGQMTERLLFGLREALAEKDAPALSSAINDALIAYAGADRLDELKANQDELRRALVEADLFLEQHESEDFLKNAIDELIMILKKEGIREEYRTKMALLRKAEEEGKKDEIEVLLQAIASLAREL